MISSQNLGEKPQKPQNPDVPKPKPVIPDTKPMQPGQQILHD